MEEKKEELKLLWLRTRLIREEKRTEAELEHLWSMWAIKIGTGFLVLIGLIRLSLW